ncbi:MAG: membrane protein insertase YidC [Candidatus Saccharibacteria bacterium]|nr:membrane protein insertase YidC [Candidatus Saccharibacteria bacterium]
MFELIDFLVIRPIVNILFVIYNYVGDFGVAIVLFTVLVKILIWPLMKGQLYQTKLIRKIQPELAEIKKRANGNREIESLEMMNLYKKNNIKPFRSILLLIIQLPIFFALYGAIRCMVLPTETDNIKARAYEPIAQMERIQEIIGYQEDYLAALAEKPEEAHYDFHPQLLGKVDLDVKASSVFSETNLSTVVTLGFCIAAGVVQYLSSKMTNPSGKKGKSFRQMMREAEQGKEPDQADLNAMTARQMSLMMPMMMFLIMFNLPGALAFYYFVNSLFSLLQQKYILGKAEDTMEMNADKSVVRELNKIQEAEVVTNKKTGTKITRIKASDAKKSGAKARAKKAKIKAAGAKTETKTKSREAEKKSGEQNNKKRRKK